MKRIYRGFKTDCPTGICLDICFYNKCYQPGFISSICNIYCQWIQIIHKAALHIWIWRVCGLLLRKWWWGWAKSSRVHWFCKKCIVIRKLLFVCTSTIYMISPCYDYRACHRGHILFHLFQVFPLGRRHIQWYVEFF